MYKESRQIFGGALISYLLIALNAIYGIVATPYIVSQIGDASFGVYKAVTAFSASLMVIDFGLGGTVQRYIANFRANGKETEIGSFVGMSILEAVFLSVIAFIALIVIYLNIDNIFSAGMSADQITIAQRLFIILGFTVIFHLFENLLSGVLMGYGDFIVSNGLRLIRIIIRFIATFFFLYYWKSPLTLVIIDCALVFSLLIFELIYSINNLSVKISFRHFDKPIFKQSIIYSLMLFVTALSNQVNGNLDNVVVGAFLPPRNVAIYSIALIVFGMFEQISFSISGLLLPKVSFLLKNGLDLFKEYLIKIGRIQFLLLGSIYGAFVVLGKDFIYLWMGEDYSSSYYIAIIIMGPAVLELIVSVCLTMLRALNRLKFKTIITFLMMLLNAVLTILGVKYYGFYMAAIATAITYIIGPVIIMNLYYRKEFGLKMLGIYRSIFSNTWICIIISMIITFITVSLFHDNITRFAIGLLVYIAALIASMLICGFNRAEKDIIIKYTQKYIKC